MKKILMAVAVAAASLTGIYAMNITPRSLHDGDKIAIVSPAGPVDSTLVYAAADTLRAQGFLVDIMPHAIGRVGQYAAADSDRLADLRSPTPPCVPFSARVAATEPYTCSTAFRNCRCSATRSGS